MSDLLKPFEVCISQTLSKNKVVVKTDKYEVEDVERDEDGTEFVDYTTKNVNWEKEYMDQHLTPLSLISVLNHICTTLMEENDILEICGYELEVIKEECERWIEDDITVMEE